MSNFLKYVEGLFGEKTKAHEGSQNSYNNEISYINQKQKSPSYQLNFPNISTISNNNTNNNSRIYPSDNQNQMSNFEMYKKRKEIKENISEESSIKIFGEATSFSLDLKVFGRSIFQNLILTVTATINNQYSTNGTPENSIIPIKCIWKRFKNETEISISNINTNSYIPTAEDIGYTIIVEAIPVDRNLYGETPLFAQYGPIEMDINIKSTLELLLTSGGTKFSCFLYDCDAQEKKTDKEIILHINSNELKICEMDYNGKEKELEKTKLHQLNPQIFLNTKDSLRFKMRFFCFEAKSENPKQNGLVDYAKLSEELKNEYELIAMSKQCRELIYLLIQIFLIDEKIKNSKLFATANYNLLPQDTKIGVTDLISEIKTLREENSVLIKNMKFFENMNSNLKKEMKELEEEFQSSLETINISMRTAAMNGEMSSKIDCNCGKNSEKNDNFGLKSSKNLSNYNNQYQNITQTNSNKTNNTSISNNSNKLVMGVKQNFIEGNSLEMKAKYEELKEMNLNLISKEKALREENKDLILKIEINKNTINDLTSENKKLKSEVTQFNKDFSSISKNSGVLSEQKNKLQTKVEILEQEKQNLQNLTTELKAKCLILENEENSKQKNLLEQNETKIDELHKKIENSNYEIKNLIIQRNLLTNQKDNITKEFEKLKNDQKQSENIQNELKEQIDNLKEVIKQKESINLTLNNEAEKYKKNNKEIKQKYELLEIEHNSLKENFDKNFLNINNMESFDFNANMNRNNDNDMSRMSSYIDGKLHKISSEEMDEFEMLKREKEESDALIMQLKSNSQAKDLEISSLKKSIDNLRKK